MEKIWTKKPIYTCWSCGDDVFNATDMYCEFCVPFITKNLSHLEGNLQKIADQLFTPGEIKVKIGNNQR